MKLKLLYDTLRIEVFDTNELTEKKALGDRNLLTNYELRMDRIDGDRLWLEVLWYDASSKVKSDSPDGSLATARRTNGWRFLLADPEDMEHLVAVYLDDELVMWRESGELVFGALFKLHETLYYSDEKMASVSRRAVLLHDYMKRKFPEISDDPEALCAKIGYPLVAYNAMARVESTDMRKSKYPKEGELR